jgi:hypothetical protein
MRQYNRAYIDGNNNEAPDFTNLLILKTSVTIMSGCRARTRNIATTGSGEGYFVNGGRYIEINWSRPDYSDQFTYSLRDGSELKLGIGRTYICFISDQMEPDFS